HLDAVDPHQLIARALVGLADAVHGGGLCRRNRRDEQRDGDRYDRDGDGTTEQARHGLWLLVVLGTGRPEPTSIRSGEAGLDEWGLLGPREGRRRSPVALDDEI